MKQPSNPVLASLLTKGYTFRSIVEDADCSTLPDTLEKTDNLDSETICGHYMSFRKQLQTLATQMDGETMFFADKKQRQEWEQSMQSLVEEDDQFGHFLEADKALSPHEFAKHTRLQELEDLKWERIQNLWFLYNSLQYAEQTGDEGILKEHLQAMAPRIESIQNLVTTCKGLQKQNLIKA